VAIFSNNLPEFFVHGLLLRGGRTKRDYNDLQIAGALE
jgi:hypothetical protein